VTCRYDRLVQSVCRDGRLTSRVGSLALRAEWRLGGGARLALGAWGRWQDSRLAGIPSFLEWGGLLEASFDVLGD